MKALSPEQLLKLWQKMSVHSLGKKAFSKILGQVIPYTGSISPLIEEWETGRCHVSIKDSRKVRNHLNCIHAIALANLGELSTGLAVTSILPEGGKIILKNLEIEYIKKAKGPIYAIAESGVLPSELGSENIEHKVSSKIFDQNKIHVCSAHAVWVVRK
ncbi:DUF4442 domain-containing protein [bacterium]|nr:DUF4442 domain-containing protein [bacterium]